MIGLFSAIEPLRIANGLSGKKLFSWELISENGEAVTASNGMSLNTDVALDACKDVDSLVVVASFDPQLHESKKILTWLKQLSRKGTHLGAIDTGAHLLAKAGLLEGYRITMHWDAAPAFVEEFPAIEVTDELFEIDRNRFTCAGGTASIDMMVHLITLKCGRDFALEVCEQCIHTGIRSEGVKQRIQLTTKLGIQNTKLLKLIHAMEDHIQNPLEAQALAAIVNLSTRQVERLFKKYLQETPSSYYLKKRLERAHQLLTQSTLSVMDVAVACGFNSAAHFSRVYKQQFGRPPTQDMLG
jgi:AraC family carnitine catabolism transcriptional activator